MKWTIIVISLPECCWRHVGVSSMCETSVSTQTNNYIMAYLIDFSLSPFDSCSKATSSDIGWMPWKKIVELNFWNGALHLKSLWRKHVATIHKNAHPPGSLLYKWAPIKNHSYFANWDWHLMNWWRGDFKILSKRHDVRYCCLCAVILSLTFFQIPVSICRVTYSWLQRMNNCTFSIYQVKSNNWLGNNVFFNYCSAHWNPSKHCTHKLAIFLLKNTRVDNNTIDQLLPPLRQQALLEY